MFVYLEIDNFYRDDFYLSERYIEWVKGDLFVSPFDCGVPYVVFTEEMLKAFAYVCVERGNVDFEKYGFDSFSSKEFKTLRKAFTLYRTYRDRFISYSFDNTKFKIFVLTKVKDSYFSDNVCPVDKKLSAEPYVRLSKLLSIKDRVSLGNYLISKKLSFIDDVFTKKGGN